MSNSLPAHDADPFDRMPVVQAQSEDLTITTAEPATTAMPFSTIDASD